MQQGKKYPHKQQQQTRFVQSSSQSGLVKLTSNLSPLTLGNQTYYQYPFNLNPETENDRKIAKIIQNMKLLQNITYVLSGKNIFTKKPLSQGNIIFTKESFTKGLVPPEETVVYAGTTYKVQITAPIAISSNNVTPAYLQLCHIVQKTILAKVLKYTKFGRNYFDVKQGIKYDNVTFFPGIVSSLYSCQKGILLNTDVVYKAISTKTVLDMIKVSSKEEVEKSIVRTAVLCNYGKNRTVVIDGIAWNKNPMHEFTDCNGRQLSFVNYFFEQYKITKIEENQPLLFSKRKDGSINYYIPQLMSPTEIKITQKLREYPNQRFDRINKSLQIFTSNDKALQCMNEWGFGNISRDMVHTSGRILGNEAIQFSNETVNSSSWNLQNKKAVTPVTFENVLWLAPQDFCNYQNVKRSVESAIKELGCEVRTSVLKNVPIHGFTSAINNSANENFDFIFVILPLNAASEFYANVKLAIQNSGILSQCIRAVTASKITYSIAFNMASEACAKKGSIIWTLNFDDYKDTMVIGLDVYHSGEKKVKTKPSVVGFVATLDSKFMQVYSSTICQEAGRELVSSKNMKEQFVKALQCYKAKNQKYPSKVVVFRDGVGEGQLAAIQDTEVGAMKSVLTELGIENTTTLTVVITLKRIHVKFFVTADKSNPFPGTVVDSDVVAKDRLEFFLVAHKPISGAAIPVKYQCLYSNEPMYSSNQTEFKKSLQLLAFKLCHCYVNKLSTIKVPSVAQYAHKIAEYVGAHVGNPFSKFETLPYYL